MEMNLPGPAVWNLPLAGWQNSPIGLALAVR